MCKATSEENSIPLEVNGRFQFAIRFRPSPRGKVQVWNRFYTNLEAAQIDVPQVLHAEYHGRARLLSVTQVLAPDGSEARRTKGGGMSTGQENNGGVMSEEKRKVYVVGAPRPTDAQALAIPLFTRSGRQVLRVASLNRETGRVSCEIEGTNVEHTYDLADLIHHYGEPGVRIHLRAAGYEVGP